MNPRRPSPRLRPFSTHRRSILPALTEEARMDFAERKYRSEDTWEAVRRGWEQGETAASLARRYDVGLANLWRRRAAEGWERRLEKDPPPEPLEGWKMYAERRLDEFEARVAETRDLAQRLLRIMQGEELNEVPTWHMGYLVVFRANHLGPETAAADRERFRDRDWAPAVWDEAGRFRPQYEIDRRLLLMHRKEWREEVGLPEGAAEDYP